MTPPQGQPEDRMMPADTGGGAGYRPSSTTGPDGRVILNPDVSILPDRQRPDLASFETRAFEAQDQRSGAPHFALLCGAGHGMRLTNIASYRNIKNPHLLRLTEAGIVTWPADARQYFALVFEQPAGRRMMEPSATAPVRIHEDRLVSSLIQPVFTVLSALHDADMVHGAVTPENIYIAGEAGTETIILGECLSSAPSFRLHPFFETIERAMAQPSGRGRGTIKNDLYALGMCVAIALRGRNLFAGKTSQQIIEGKIDSGSYAYISSGERLPANIADFLRGVLNDDEAQRWGLEEVGRWLEGRRPGGRQASLTSSAPRPFLFREKKFWDLRSLAYDFSRHPAEAAAAVEDDQFMLWIKRNFDDPDMQKNLAEVLEREGTGNRERLVTAVCMAMDARAPVHYKGVSAFPDGLGMALCHALWRGEELQPYGEIISLQLANNWVQHNFDDLPDASSQLTLLEKCRNYLAQRMAGYGLERVAYVMNKEAPCLSPVLKDFMAVTPGHLLLALETLARRGERPENMLDRHMLAFISVREAKMIDPHLGIAISGDRGQQVLGIAKTLAAIQRRFSTGPLPAVGNSLISMSAPAIDRFRDRDLRAIISKKMSSLSDGGNLSAILELMDAPAIVQEDIRRFGAGRQEFSALLHEKARLQKMLQNKKTFGLATGRQVAMVVSSIFGGLAMIALLMQNFLER